MRTLHLTDEDYKYLRGLLSRNLNDLVAEARECSDWIRECNTQISKANRLLDALKSLEKCDNNAQI